MSQTKLLIDVENNRVEIVDLTEQEISDIEAARADAAANRAAEQAKSAARQSALEKLAALGLTADEIAAL